MTAFYNEIDPFAAAWLRELIKQNLVAPGVVDERSIVDIEPIDLMGYEQVHLFAGIGVWSYALRQAGWKDDRPVWTGSCPCQPFSSAGKGGGFTDERHLWPAMFHLIQQCQPSIILGEQVASKATEPWIDLVHSDLENVGYAFGCVPFPSAGVSAPHIRDRAYWVAYAEHDGFASNALRGSVGKSQDERRVLQLERCGSVGGMECPNGSADQPSLAWAGERPVERRSEVGGVADTIRHQEHQEQHRSSADERERSADGVSGCNALSRVADPKVIGFQGEPVRSNGEPPHRTTEDHVFSKLDNSGRPGPTNGFWRDVDWLYCRDDRWRPVEPGTFPLVNGASARVGRLRGYGNAINAQAAQVFIQSVMEIVP